MEEEITELKELVFDLEQRLEIALLSANQVWWEWDIVSGKLKTHAIKECILGYDLGEIIHTVDFWMDALPPEERDEVRKSLDDHLSGKNTMWAMEHRYRTPQGDYKWVLEAGRVVKRDEEGNPLRMVGITQNIHDKKLRDEELKQKNRALSQALELKDVLLATTSHDVMNTLNGGLGLAQILKEEEIGQTKEFDMITNSLRTAVNLISSIHEMAKGNLTEIDHQRVDLIDFLHEIRDHYEPVARNKGIELRLTIPESDSIMTDRFALRRILDNLVGNALKFTRNGFVSIGLESKETEIAIEVRDSGPGIPADKEHLLFEPFKKLSSASEGSGLGLSICRDLAGRLSGNINYQANRPTGSVFRLEIPRKHVESVGKT